VKVVLQDRPRGKGERSCAPVRARQRRRHNVDPGRRSGVTTSKIRRRDRAAEAVELGFVLESRKAGMEDPKLTDRSLGERSCRSCCRQWSGCRRAAAGSDRELSERGGVWRRGGVRQKAGAAEAAFEAGRARSGRARAADFVRFVMFELPEVQAVLARTKEAGAGVQYALT